MKLYRDLTPEEKAEFRAWARANYEPLSEIKGIWHPVVQEECTLMNREHDLSAEEFGVKPEDTDPLANMIREALDD